MLVEVKIPVVGESIVEVQLGQWHKSEGEAVQKDQPLVVIESEKATVDLPAPESGKLTRILCQAGDTVHVGTTIAQIETDGAAGKPQPATAQPTVQPSSKAVAPAKPPAAAQASPSTRKSTRPPTPAKKEMLSGSRAETAQVAQPEEPASETTITEPTHP